MKLENFEAKEEPEFLKVYTGHTDVVSCVCIVDNTRFASAGGDRTVKVWSIDTGY